MTKVELRRKFAELAGRLDLVTDYAGADYTDNGADFFLKAGQRELDRMFSHPKDVARYWDTVAAGVYYVKMQECRAVQNVWINNSEDRTELAKRDYAVLKNYYADLESEITQETPLYYCPAFIRTYDDTDKNATGTFINYVVDDSDSYNAIIFLPPPDEAFDVEVFGLFYSTWPSAESDTSFWMEIHPMVSVWAGLYMLEVSYRNTTGANDWLAAITRTGSGIDKDTVEESLADDGDLVMEG